MIDGNLLEGSRKEVGGQSEVQNAKGRKIITRTLNSMKEKREREGFKRKASNHKNHVFFRMSGTNFNMP